MKFDMKRSPLTPSVVSIALRVSIGLVMLDSIIEISFASSTSSWLRNTASHKIFQFIAYGSRHPLSGLPRNLIANQIDMTNAAAIIAFLVVGGWGFLSLWLRNLTQYRTGSFAKINSYNYYLWVSCSVAALLLTVATLAYVSGVTNALAGQRIEKSFAVDLNGSIYYKNTWTPQSWFTAVLRLNLIGDREDITKHLNIMRVWQYNLISMFFFQLIETTLAYLDYNRWIHKPKVPEACSRF
ncbi:hypothetical protein F5Y03DRAFT_395813 [Xylaria venustula]|nr:hypothetical protein F5Y03DRAFT_395813 [Xylaria venustula]